MTKKPIDVLMDRVNWKELKRDNKPSSNLLYATHKGILNLGEIKLKCFILNDGRRIIDKKDFEKFLDLCEEVMSNDSVR